jgi:hypothetical protein
MTAVAETAVEVGNIVPTWISIMATTAAQIRRLRRGPGDDASVLARDA